MHPRALGTVFLDGLNFLGVQVEVKYLVPINMKTLTPINITLSYTAF